MTQPAALYARVSSNRQKENHTISSQTAALVDYAASHGNMVPPEWRFQDEGDSGATLLRPGLEALRDLAAAGQIRAALVYSPDRLSRKYSYQVLLAEELARCGVELVFLKAPSSSTAEDRLLVQFQGMIAEYERARIAERSRHGKRHRAQQGSINVLSGAPTAIATSGRPLQTLETAVADGTKYLRLVETLSAFRTPLGTNADALDVAERQKSSAVARQGDSGGERHTHDPALDPPLELRTKWRRRRSAPNATPIAATTNGPTRPRLSFAFKQWFHRC